MPMLQLILLALIQGITEFLPISSSGHLILLPNLTGMADQGLAIDVAVHLGTLAAVILYFWADVRTGLRGLADLGRGRRDTPGARLALGLGIATIPVVIAGMVLKLTGIDAQLRSVVVIGWTMLGFGILLWWADQKGAAIKTEADWTLGEAFKMGLWQTVALFPGTSRSGICITGGRFMGYTRHDAAKLSMLMSIPTILASGVLLAADVAGQANAQVAIDGLIGAVFAFGAALAALALMMRLLQSVSFTPYVIYRVLLGAGLLLWVYT
ncbi:UDP pyrophosphate phosphatase [Salipiger aestuarii]|uniref:Undecaprenyl-diphosphatase n=1 Tax=Salipiger aestuarii TaxID=568098 RepID=A0A327Y4W7_9RHOB|nr:undecaprenyl-diphosphate phosphatase [Salipiger aestuarii]KAB2540670.1 UDP pyrophosphate phosphatase [Salipiger aestuarii]RAK15477.1 undecaprenyl-diphosphatase [Salipiger aestuarii]